MNILLIILICVMILLIIGIIWCVVTYNKLIKLSNKVDNAWAQIDVQLQRRGDLIPNLIETVKGYARHEQSTLDSVVQARSSLVDASSPESKMSANDTLTSTLKSLFAVAEQYPELKANTNFAQLQNELSDTEDKISGMRTSYNDAIMAFNNVVESFPSSIVAGMFHFKTKESFTADAAAKAVPKVQF